ncbi:response regulator [Pedobacter jejuensis]|uniref:Response regulator n=1 Tax=Pedobacter jejuensis TaxID=1268550 RepID=A0A3N0BSN0_9SPHI|nr:response regulator [Pedobacter jejuensis]RNL51686.1 response regulator [Pedobacter jejuensis]
MEKNILVVEDNTDIREIIGILLNEEQYEVHLCKDAGSFRKEIFQRRPDMVILDVMLPDGNGIDLCCEIKSDYRTGHIPVLMMSAHSNLLEIRKKCEADDFISKPFDINLFIAKVSQIVRQGNINN